MEEKPTNNPRPEWLQDYTYVALLGILFILLFYWFTTTYNLP